MAVHNNFITFAIFALLFEFTASSAVNYTNLFANPITDPCVGRRDGRARAITMDSLIDDCSKYFDCYDGTKTTEEPYSCYPNYFDAEIQECVSDHSVCFQCPYDTDYRLIEVPHAPVQFIQCFKNRALLLACSEELEFDDRIQQCNVKRLCRIKNLVGRRCQPGGPHYEIDPFDPSV